MVGYQDANDRTRHGKGCAFRRFASIYGRHNGLENNLLALAVFGSFLGGVKESDAFVRVLFAEKNRDSRNSRRGEVIT